MDDNKHNITFTEYEYRIIADLLVAEYERLSNQVEKYNCSVGMAVCEKRRSVESCLDRMFYGIEF